MKTIRDFLRKHALLLLAALVVVSVPVGVALGKYAASKEVTSSLNLTVTAATAGKTYTIDKAKMQSALKALTTKPTALKFIKGGSALPGGLTKTASVQADGSGEIGLYQDGTTVYIAPVDDNNAVMYAPEDCSSFLSKSVTGLSSLTSITFDNLDTAKVTNMSDMFLNCSSLTTLDVSGFNTDNVKNMSGMFSGCSKVSVLEVGGFNTSNVKDMSLMFLNCSALTTLDVSKFNTGSVNNMSKMFSGCAKVSELDVRNFNTSNVEDMSAMFLRCSTLTALNVKGFDTRKVTVMSNMFSTCSNVASLDLSNFNTSMVTAMTAMFYKCSSLTTLDVSSFDTRSVIQMGMMFQGCSPTVLDLSSFDTHSVKNMMNMFNSCGSLEKIYVGDNFNTDNVTSYSNMFTGCSKLKGSQGTAYSSSCVDKTYAHIDGGTANPGYFWPATGTQSLTNSVSIYVDSAYGFGVDSAA